jgi:hypothetical protein
MKKSKNLSVKEMEELKTIGPTAAKWSTLSDDIQKKCMTLLARATPPNCPSFTRDHRSLIKYVEMLQKRLLGTDDNKQENATSTPSVLRSKNTATLTLSEVKEIIKLDSQNHEKNYERLHELLKRPFPKQHRQNDDVRRFVPQLYHIKAKLKRQRLSPKSSVAGNGDEDSNASSGSETEIDAEFHKPSVIPRNSEYDDKASDSEASSAHLKFSSEPETEIDEYSEKDLKFQKPD